MKNAARWNCLLSFALVLAAVAAVGSDSKAPPLLLEPNEWIMVPLEGTYQTAFEMMPRRWREVLGSSVPQVQEQ